MNTRLITAAAALLCAALLPLTGVSATNITGNVTLTADADWRGLGQVVLADGASINLAEHALKVDGFAQSPLGEDATSPSGVVTSSPATLTSGLPEFLFDNRFYYTTGGQSDDPVNNHRICCNGSFAVTYDFGDGNGECIRAYRIYFGTAQPDDRRAPRNWTFAGSTNNTDWITLDSRSGQTGWSNGESRTFSFVNAATYRYYRLQVTARVSDTYLELFQLEFFRDSEYCTDRTVPGAERVTSSTLSAGGAAYLFDNDFTHSSWHRLLTHRNNFPCDITYDFGSGCETALNGYRIYYKRTDSDSSDRAPTAWEFQGSNDATTWTALDSHSGETEWTSGASREFQFVNGTPYRYYRLHVTDCGSNNYLELYQLEYLGRPAVFSKSKSDDPVGVDLTEPANGHASGSATPYGGSVECLFDNTMSHGLYHRICIEKGKQPFDIVYDFGVGANVNVTSYKFYYDTYATPKTTDRAPKKWTFEGSNDGSAWTPLDSRENITDWTAPPCERTFSFANPDSYRFYKLHLEQSVGNTYIEFYQLEYFHDKVFGELTVDVASGTAQTNGVISLDGDLRLVKEGAGSFMAACPNQTYCGGTVLSHGTLVAGEPNGTDSDDSAVTVCAGGTFDVNGLGGWWNYPVVLDGGTLRCAMPATDAPQDTFRYIALTSDSTLEVEGDFVMGDGTGTDGRLDLDGHVLTTSVSSNGLWTLNLPSVTAGTIAFDLGKEDAEGGKKVLAYGTRPAGVRFKKTAGSYYGVTAQSDGVYVRSRATVLIIR